MPRPGSEPVELEGRVTGIGGAATRVNIDGKEVWIPHSVLHNENEWDYEEAAIGDQVAVVVQQWFAEKEELV